MPTRCCSAVDAHRRLARRSFRPPAHVPRRHRGLRRGFTGVRPLGRTPAAHCRRARCKVSARRFWCPAASRSSAPHSMRPSAAGDRDLVRIYRDHDAVGPLLGGRLVEHVSWRVDFPHQPAARRRRLGCRSTHVPESRDAQAARRAGSARLAAGTPGSAASPMACSIAGRRLARLDASSRRPPSGVWPHGGLLVVRAPRPQSPMLPLALFRSRTFSAANAVDLLPLCGARRRLFFFCRLR